MNQYTRRTAIGMGVGASAVGAAMPSHGFQAAEFASSTQRRGFMTAPVRINGEGPFPFAIDTAANASVITSELAGALALPRAADVAMHTLVGREVVGSVHVEQIRTGALDHSDVNLALGARLGLDGVEGLIGTDLLTGLRLDLQFRGAQRLRIASSRKDSDGFFDMPSARSSIVYEARRNFADLAMIEARAGGIEMLAVLDTGAQVSIGNTALARLAGATRNTLASGESRASIRSPTGEAVQAETMMLSHLRIGGVAIHQLPILVGDFHTFDIWGLRDTPCMLMGVDVMGLFNGVSIDLRRNEVVFEV